MIGFHVMRKEKKRVEGLGFMSREGRRRVENDWVSCDEEVEEKS